MMNDARRESPKGPLGLRLAVLEGRDAGRAVPLGLDGKPVRAGTARTNDLVLHDEQLSQTQLECRLVPDGIAIRHLGGAVGTFLGAARIIEAVVPAGTRLRAGSTVLSAGASSPAADLPSRFAAEGLVFASGAMTAVAASIQAIAPFTMSVLIEGETGTGKEVVARALHALSMRANGPFVIVDCGALPPNLIESELFGHERGAFTGAEGRRPGAFELAHGGTLLLDEIGELPRESQSALLGVLQRRSFRRVGGGREVAVDVRVVSATNRDLRREIDRGAFRADLFYRLASSHLVLPPLRERPEDVPVLIARFLQELAGTEASSPFDAASMAALSAHPWRGNARELRAFVENALATGRTDPARTAPSVAPSPPSAPLPSSGPRASSSAPVDSYRDARARALTDFERGYLGQLISACAGNASEAARVARMDRPHMLRLLRRHGLR